MAVVNVNQPTPKTWVYRLTGRLYWVALLALVAIAVAAFYLLVWKTITAAQTGGGAFSTKELEESVETARQQLQQAQAQDAHLKTLPTNDLDRLAIALPNEPAVPELLVQLEAIARETGMISPDINVKVVESKSKVKPKDDGGAEIVNGSVTFVASSYEQLKTVAAVMQQNLRLLDITQLQYAPETGKTTISFTAYFVP